MRRTDPHVLVIDDEPALLEATCDYLAQRGYATSAARDCREARRAFSERRPDAVVLDFSLSDGNALDLLPSFKREAPEVPVVILTAYASIELAVRTVKEGAEQFLTKPTPLATLETVVRRMVEGSRNRKHALAGRRLNEEALPDPFVGESAAIRQLESRIRRVARSDSPVLLTGETGTGKTLLAKWLHRGSRRHEEPVVDLNCAAFPGDLLETELFGHEKGAFTGADQAKTGLIEAADRGTLFLDEIGDLDLSLQPKLLKVLEEGRFRRVGSVREQRVDVRLVAATNRDLKALVDAGAFRDDLYYRINIVPLHVPPLRERREDVPALARSLLTRLGAEMGRPRITLARDAEAALAMHHWPGNIRELRNVLERAVLFCGGETIGRDDLWFETAPASPEAVSRTDLTLEELEAWYIRRVLAEERGRVGEAAARLGVPRSTLYQRLKRHGIPTSRSGTR